MLAWVCGFHDGNVFYCWCLGVICIKFPFLLVLFLSHLHARLFIPVRSLSFILTCLASALVLHEGFLSFLGLGDTQKHGAWSFRVDKSYSI